MTAAPPDLLAVAEAVRGAAVEPADAAAGAADLAGLLAAGGVPDHAVPRLAQALDAVLGEAAAQELAADPWRLLAVGWVTPEQADAYARARVGDAGPADPRRSRALVCRLLDRAAADGHTALPAAAVLRALPPLGVPDPDAALAAAVADGTVLALEARPAPSNTAPSNTAPSTFEMLVAHERWAMAEDGVAEGVARLLATARHLCPPDRLADLASGRGGAAVRAAATAGVSVAAVRTAAQAADVLGGLDALARAAGVPMCVVAASPRAARAWRASGLLDAGVAITTGPGATVRVAAAGLVVLPEAALLDVDAAAALLEAAAEGAHVVFVGDPAGPAGPGPGDLLADLAACPGVAVAAAPAGTGALELLAAAVAAGTLPDPSALTAGGEREVVVVPARTDAEAAHRVAQLVGDSIPRAVGIPAAGVVVISPRADGEAGAAALDARLRAALGERPERGGDVAGAPWATTPLAALDATWPAVVLVLPASAAGSLGPDLLAGAVARAQRHLSVVTAAGPALERAVATGARRARRTRLPGLLQETIGGW